jgi:hypothetical protein
MVEARALELLALSLESLGIDGSDPERSDRGLGTRDLQCLQQARRILEQEFLAPPTITTLDPCVPMGPGVALDERVVVPGVAAERGSALTH